MRDLTPKKLTPNKPLAVVLILTAIGIGLYWTDYYTGASVHSLDARWYTAFENSFVAADAWIAACAFFAGLAYAVGHRSASPLGLLAGSSLVYLSAMDITFNLENGIYTLMGQSFAVQTELAINIATSAIGVTSIIISWRRSYMAKEPTFGS